MGGERLWWLQTPRKLFYEAAMKRDVCMEVPEEDLEVGESRQEIVWGTDVGHARHEGCRE